MTGRQPDGRSQAEAYRQLTQQAAFVDLSDRTKLQLTGKDRAAFLHNLCTQDIKRMQPGEGCEAFLTNVQGKVLGHVLVFCGEDSLDLDTVAGAAEPLLMHLDHYLITEDVAFADQTTELSEFLLAGPRLVERLASAHVPVTSWPASCYGHASGSIGPVPVTVRRVDIVPGGGWMLVCHQKDKRQLADLLAQQQIPSANRAALEMARIEHGFPWYGQDIDASNLPQEVDRNDQAISFTKGCYLGQETVARIDALGHVNRVLCGILFPGETVPKVGSEIIDTTSGKRQGQITSAAFIPSLDGALTLAYVRCSMAEPGTELQCGEQFGRVVALPVR